MGHIKDRDFIRGEVPMTKDEVRAISIAKLDLRENSILVDIGAGTGSVGIEGSTYLTKGYVYGIEKNPKGCELIKENLKKFRINNYKLIEGIAPQDLDEIKNIGFDRMFIGGSSGSMEEIIDFFIEYSRDDSIFVINLIALESLAEVIDILKRKNLKDIEIVNISVSRSKKLGNYTMMMGENPIYIINGRK